MHAKTISRDRAYAANVTRILQTRNKCVKYVTDTFSTFEACFVCYMLGSIFQTLWRTFVGRVCVLPPLPLPPTHTSLQASVKCVQTARIAYVTHLSRPYCVSVAYRKVRHCEYRRTIIELHGEYLMYVLVAYFGGLCSLDLF